MGRRALPWIFLLHGLAAAAASQPPVIVHSNDVLGEIEPCGCRTNPLGGMIRKEKLLRTHPWLQNTGFLSLDAGNLFFSSIEIPETLQAQTQVQSHGLARALKETGLDAMVPGPKDFALGLGTLVQLAKESGTLVLAANLEVLAAKEGTKHLKWKKPFKGSHVFNVKDGAGKSQRIAVIAVVGKSLFESQNPKGIQFRVSDPIKAARLEVERLSKKADWIVALTHESVLDDQKLAEAVSAIGWIVGGGTQAFLQEPIQIGKTSVHQSSFRNQHIGLIRVATPRESQLAELGAALDPSGEEPSRIRPLLAEVREQIKQANLESEKLIQKATDQAARERTPKYKTFVACADCHTKQTDFWRKTRHAGAYETLVKAGSHTNKECLACHSVGMGDPEGWTDFSQLARWNEAEQQLPIWLKGLRDARSPEAALQITHQAKSVHATVQCENCHLPVRDHPFGLDSGHKPVVQQTCLGCHTPARAPAWYNAEAGGNGKLNEQKLKQAFAKMTCPRDDTTP